jgi:hypothetical protein
MLNICSNLSPSDFRSTPGGLCEGRMTELAKNLCEECIKVKLTSLSEIYYLK